jgi:hypothetical protein
MAKKTKWIKVRVSEELHQQVKAAAKEDKQTPSDWVRGTIYERLNVALEKARKPRIDSEVDRTLYNRFRGFVSAYNNEKRTFMSHDEQRQVSELGASQWAELPPDRIDEAFTILTNFTRHPNNAGALLEDLITGTKLVIARTTKGEK